MALVANDSGLDIVTDSKLLHQVVVSTEEEDLFDSLLDRKVGSSATPSVELVDRLAEIVISTTFDVRRLKPQQISKLLKDGKDLRGFKNALLPVLQAIPPMSNVQERERRLKDAAKQVVDEWAKYKKSLPKFALDAIVDASEIKFPEIGATMLAGATTGMQLGAAAGLSIGLLTYAGLKVFRQYRENTLSPYQYLNRISKSVSSLTLPPLPG